MHTANSPQPKSYLTNGPIMTMPERRAAAIERMAAYLIRFNATASDGDARRALNFGGYPSLDVQLLAPEARRLAVFLKHQEIVAREMSKS